MVRSTRTTALLVAVALTVALSGCAGVLDDAASTETSMPSATSTDAPVDATTASPAGGTITTRRDAATTAQTATATTAAASPTPTRGNATARFVEDGEGSADPSDNGTESGDGETLATVSLEIANSPSERRRGLMYRESLPAGHGMVFVYDDAAPRSFWMKNTRIPLDMVFVSANGTVLNVEHADVQPNASDSELASYRSEGAAQYVVEVNRGFANRTGVEAGTRVEFSGLNGTES